MPDFFQRQMSIFCNAIMDILLPSFVSQSGG
jgi:hypothetical protein